MVDKSQKEDRLESKMKTAKDIPVFSEAQREAFFSHKMEGLDEALAILDATNTLTIGQTNNFSANKKGGS